MKTVTERLTSDVEMILVEYKNHDYGNGPGVAETHREWCSEGKCKSWRLRNVTIGTNGYISCVEKRTITPKIVKDVKIEKYFNCYSDAKIFASKVKSGVVYYPPLWGECRFYVVYVAPFWLCVNIDDEIIPIYNEDDMTRSKFSLNSIFR